MWDASLVLLVQQAQLEPPAPQALHPRSLVLLEPLDLQGQLVLAVPLGTQALVALQVPLVLLVRLVPQAILVQQGRHQQVQVVPLVPLALLDPRVRQPPEPLARASQGQPEPLGQLVPLASRALHPRSLVLLVLLDRQVPQVRRARPAS